MQVMSSSLKRMRDVVCLAGGALTVPWPFCAVECQSGGMGTLLLANPAGHNVLNHSSFLTETQKVFGLRSRRLKLYLDEDLTQGMRTITQIT